VVSIHALFIALSVGCICCCLFNISKLLPLLGFLSPSGQWNIRLYALRLSALLFCLLFHLSVTIYAFDHGRKRWNYSVDKHIQCNNLTKQTKSAACNLFQSGDLSSLVYVLYSLEFFSFVQCVWPLDASSIGYLWSHFQKKDDGDLHHLKYIQNIYGKRLSRRKEQNGSVILRHSSKEKNSTSDTSTIEQWLVSNRLVTRRPAAIPTKLIPDLKPSQNSPVRRRKEHRNLKKRNKTWSVKEGSTPHHRKIIYRQSTDSESSDVDNWRTRFSNYSLTNENHLTAALEKINQFGVSTTQSETTSDQKSDRSWFHSKEQQYSCLDKIRLSDLTSDDD